MYARSTTIQAQPSSIDAGVAHVRDEIMPALRDIDGCVGLSLLVDRQSGRCIVTTCWDSEDAMRASEERVRSIRHRAADEFGGIGSPTVEEWELAVVHRDHRSGQGACARVTWVTSDPAQTDQNIEYYKAAVLPDMESLEGFCSTSLMVNRTSGRAVSCASFDSREAMDRNREQSNALKNQKIQEAGVAEADEHEFELVLAHLRAPELV
ncbi:MAG TPA: antibiotic biosynthesis monooxygenase [Mycobacterium sp.]|nr:antibiotic biosynthesis monooxygenase [Mycobacterium sp.]